MRGWSGVSPGICEAGSAVTPGRGAEQMANRLHGSSAEKAAKSLSAKNARGVLLACHAGKIYSRIVRTKIQHLLAEAAKGRQSGGIKGGSTSVPQIELSFFIEKSARNGNVRQSCLRTSKRPSTVFLRRLRWVVCCHSTRGSSCSTKQG